MNEAKHTPGPWKEGGYILWPAHGGEAQFPVHAKKRGRIALALRKEADARLIAAAPDLLAACHAAMQGEQGWAKRIHAAVAKATGAQP